MSSVDTTDTFPFFYILPAPPCSQFGDLLAPRAHPLSLVMQFAGEESVMAAFPSATILRPADIFGDEDRFLNWIAEVSASQVHSLNPGVVSMVIKPCVLCHNALSSFAERHTTATVVFD